jgi:thiol-disulfide isomerase/thioredoxin
MSPVLMNQPADSQTAPTSRKKGGFVLALVAVTLGFLVVQGAISARRSKSPYLAEGTPAPDFTFERYEGGQVSLSELRGKVVLLDFWATWCPPCIAEMPTLVNLAREYEGQGVVFLAANRDDAPIARAAVRSYAARKLPGVTQYTAFADDLTTRKYSVVSYPTLYVLDRQGKVVEARSGFTTEGQLRAQIENALKK